MVCIFRAWFGRLGLMLLLLRLFGDGLLLVPLRLLVLFGGGLLFVVGLLGC